MATNLAVFDFDKTLVQKDSDSAVMMLLHATPPKDFDDGHQDWTSYMEQTFGLIHAAGYSKEDILACIGRLSAVPGARELLTLLAERGWDIILLTDSNSVFVHHWLKVNELEDKVTAVLTNPACWSAAGRLHVRPLAHQTLCASCPSNLCKRLALAQYRQRRGAAYARVLYAGDGKNDVCPCRSLSAQDLVCPRAGFPCDTLLQSAPPAAAVLPWRDHYDIARALFPNTSPSIH